MENHKCKLCLRSFGNGKALGGHMRSHVMNLCRQSRTEQRISEETGLIPPSCDDSVVLQAGESETELIRPTPRCRRSKRIRKSRVCNIESSPVSSISDTSPEEDVAYCLMLLSKDKWMMKGEEDENSEDDSKVAVKKTKARGKYRCESCSKVFRSYQALGGHRASHKKMKPNNLEVVGNRINDENDGNIHLHKEKIHECPICYRVFSSGQALGGHKRSHFTASAAAIVSPLDCSASTSTAINVEKQGLPRIGHGGNLIDLNLPAPLDDDDDTISQIELSAVSDACFLRPH